MNTLIQEWNLDASGLRTKEDILAALSRRIAQLISGDMTAFIRLMYHLDIPEAQLDAALDSADAPALIAQLVWDRQAMKEITRRNAAPRQRNEEDDELNW